MAQAPLRKYTQSSGIQSPAKAVRPVPDPHQWDRFVPELAARLFCFQ
jgi:hypothetical protein